MAKKIVYNIKLKNIPGGGATPAPPIGPALGSKGVKAHEFCKQFNDQTAQNRGELYRVEIRVYEDKTFDFDIKPPSNVALIKKALGLKKGSAQSNRDKVAKITKAQLEEIAKIKIGDTNAYDLEKTMNMLAGTARSMGVVVTE